MRGKRSRFLVGDQIIIFLLLISITGRNFWSLAGERHGLIMRIAQSLILWLSKVWLACCYMLVCLLYHFFVCGEHGKKVFLMYTCYRLVPLFLSPISCIMLLCLKIQPPIFIFSFFWLL